MWYSGADVVVVSGHAIYWRENRSSKLKQGFGYESRIKRYSRNERVGED